MIMKAIIRNKVLILIALILMLPTGCSDFAEINKNPNQVTYGNSSPSKLLQDIIYQGHWSIFYRSWRINSQLMQYSLFVNGQELTSNYDVRATESTNIWSNFYRWASNAAHMYNLAVSKGDVNYQAIALTMKVYIAESITSIFGDIPYDDAFKWEEGISYPKYDSQEAVYRKMIGELSQANLLYDPTKPLDFPTRDLLYKGDIKKWKKFTNSLKLRLLMRVSKCDLDGVDIAAEMQTMISDPTTYPLFSNNDEAAILRYTGENPFYNGFGATTATDPMTLNNRLCKTLIKLMTDSADPRISFFADAKDGEYIGMASGQTNDYIALMTSSTCNYAAALNTDTSPSTLMNYAEVLFIMAEAQFRNLISTSMTNKELYDKAVIASVTQWTGNKNWVPGAFLAPPSTAAFNNTIERIMEQKYLSSFLVGYEAWCDYRRTGLPKMPVGPAMVNKNSSGIATLPTRLIYPLITQTTNRDNWLEAVSRLETGQDDMLSKVWFASGNRY